MKRRHANEQPVSHIDPITDAELQPDLQYEESEVREEIGKTLAALMPWGVSILAHVALIVLAFFLVWQTIVDEPKPPVVSDISIVDEFTVPSDSTELTEKPASGGESFVTPVTDVVTPFEIVAPTGTLPPVNVDVIVDPDVLRDKLKDGPGKDDEGPGKGPIPMPTGGAHNIVFLIDASGSMVDVLPFVINKLKQVVNDMQPVKVNGRLIEKKATVIFFSGKGVHEVPGGGGVKGLRTVTPTFKQQIKDWVSLDKFNFDTGGRGGAHVASALTRALSYKPQLVILLSDNLTGGGQGATQHELMQDDLINLIHKHNKANPPAKINTIQFLYEDPLVRQGLKGTLDRIADETGGKSNFVGQEDLMLR